MPVTADVIYIPEPAAPWPAGRFIEFYTENRQNANRTAIESHPAGPALMKLMKKHDEWEGTSAALRATLVVISANAATYQNVVGVLIGKVCGDHRQIFVDQSLLPEKAPCRPWTS